MSQISVSKLNAKLEFSIRCNAEVVRLTFRDTHQWWKQTHLKASQNARIATDSFHLAATMYHSFQGSTDALELRLCQRDAQRPWYPDLNEAIISDPEFAFDILPPNITTWSGKLTTPYELIAIQYGYGSKVDQVVPSKTSVTTFDGFSCSFQSTTLHDSTIKSLSHDTLRKSRILPTCDLYQRK